MGVNNLMKKNILALLVLLLFNYIYSEIIQFKNDNNQLQIIENTSEELIIEYSLNLVQKNEIIIDGKTYYHLSIDDESNLFQKGFPELPKISKSMIIPEKAKMNAEIIESSFEIFTFDICPSKGILYRDINPSEVPYEFSDQYSRNEFFPKSLIKLDSPHILRDFRGQNFHITPVQYNPKTSTVKIYNKLKIRFFVDGEDSHNSKRNVDYTNEFEEIYQNHFINFNTDRYEALEESGDMLIICADDFVDEMSSFVAWKNQKGIPTEMFSISSIGSTATNIQDFIQQKYIENSDLIFILLVGDSDQIPTLTSGGGGSDPSFVLLEGDDTYPDAYIGRFSAENSRDVQTMVDRVLYYERDINSGSWLSKGIGIGSQQGTGDDDEYDYEHLENIRTQLLNYNFTQVDQLYDGSQEGGDEIGNPSANDVLNSLQNGRSFLNYIGHGSLTSWSTSHFYIQHVNSLTNENMLPYICSVACVNGNFVGNTCFAESWLRATNNGNPTGAIAIYASSINQSWSPPMECQDEITNLLVSDEKHTIGSLFFNGSCSMMDDYGPAGASMYETWNIFGDASLQVRTDEPTEIIATHDNSFHLGDNTFLIETNFADLRVCLSQNNIIIASGFTNSAGNIELSFPEIQDSENEYLLTITGYNKITYTTIIPYETTIEELPTSPVRNIAEFEPMESVLVRYPFGIPVSLIAEISEDVTVTTIVTDANQESTVLNIYNSNEVNTENCDFIYAQTDSYWVRDYAPWFITTGDNSIDIVDFEYNRPRPNDNAIPDTCASVLEVDSFDLNLEHTGGNYMTDGMGISFSSDLVWDENSDMTHEQIASQMNDFLGIENYQLISDPNNTYIDHIDCWAKLLDVDKILIREVPATHAQYSAIEEVVDYFENQISSYGTNYELFRIYTPNNEPYSNSLILNNKVFVPQTGSNWDDEALQVYQESMPGYEVIGVSAGTHEWESTDALHCRTKGIADREMIYLSHIPLHNIENSISGYQVDVQIIDYANLPLDPENLKLFYRIESEPFTVIPLQIVEGNNYQATIPVQADGTEISYYLQAADISGKTAKHPFIGEADPHVFSVNSAIIVIPPQNVTISIINENIQLNWEIVENATQYHVFRSTNPTTDFIEIGETDLTDFIDLDSGLFTKKFYYIKAEIQ